MYANVRFLSSEVATAALFLTTRTLDKNANDIYKNLRTSSSSFFSNTTLSFHHDRCSL